MQMYKEHDYAVLQGANCYQKEDYTSFKCGPTMNMKPGGGQCAPGMKPSYGMQGYAGGAFDLNKGGYDHNKAYNSSSQYAEEFFEEKKHHDGYSGYAGGKLNMKANKYSGSGSVAGAVGMTGGAYGGGMSGGAYGGGMSGGAYGGGMSGGAYGGKMSGGGYGGKMSGGGYGCETEGAAYGSGMSGAAHGSGMSGGMSGGAYGGQHGGGYGAQYGGMSGGGYGSQYGGMSGGGYGGSPHRPDACEKKPVWNFKGIMD